MHPCAWLSLAAESVATSAEHPPEMRLLGGLLLWVLVCVLLALPLWIALRAAARRRGMPTPRASDKADVADAWQESARRLGEPR